MITTTAEALTHSPSHLVELPDGLTVQDALRIAEAISSTLAPSTRRAYGLGWTRWERWCATRSTQPLPASPAQVCAYLTELAATGNSVPTLDQAVGAISYRHRATGHDDPTTSEAVRQVRRGAWLSSPGSRWTHRHGGSAGTIRRAEGLGGPTKLTGPFPGR